MKTISNWYVLIPVIVQDNPFSPIFPLCTPKSENQRFSEVFINTNLEMKHCIKVINNHGTGC